MSQIETYNWSQMSRDQRNRLIDTRVFGNPEFCPGQLIIEQKNNPSKTPGVIAWTYWLGQCTNCKFELSRGGKGDFPKQHAPQFEDRPNYCEDMNAAMLITAHDQFKFANLKYGRDSKEWECLLLPLGNRDEMRAMAETLPEAICIAALKAVGVEVEA